jgi:hypothetical protein
VAEDQAAQDAYDDLYSPGWRQTGRRNGKLNAQRQVEILESHRDELTPLVVMARDMAVHTNRDATLLLLPETWGLNSLLVNSGRYWGFELRVAPVDKPMLAYAAP